MLLQQPIRLSEELYSGYICTPAVPAAVAHGFGCSKAAALGAGRIDCSFIVGAQGAEIRIVVGHGQETRLQPNYIAKWPTLCRQLPVMPC